MLGVKAKRLPVARAQVEIEITPEMIEAGVLAMLPFEDTIEDPRAAVPRIYRAILRASHQG
jgi:hypothetical protein